MEFQYDINQISSKCKVSKQSLYTLIKKNQAFINENSTRIQRKVYYNQAAFDFFMSYYHQEKPSEIGKSVCAEAHISNKQEIPENSPLERPSEEKQNKIQPSELEAEINALKAEIDALKKELKAKEEERKELIRQNGALILTLQQEKQEKQLFLPAPKKPFVERFKTLLKNRSRLE